MNPPSPAALPDVSLALGLAFILVVPLAMAGLALINTGLSRSRSAAHSMLAALCVVSVAAVAYLVTGFAWQGYPHLPAHNLHFMGKDWNWLGAGRLLRIPLDSSRASLAALLQLLSVGLAGLIPLGAVAERWRLPSCCLSTALLAGLIHPLFAHWVWGGGWLSSLGANYGLGLGVLDAGGSSTIQAVGGLTALSLLWMLGPRRGKYNPEGIPGALPGHNTVLVILGCFLALAGWMGLNAAGSLLFAALPLGCTTVVAANTVLGAAGGGMAAAAITRYRFGKPDTSLCANGWVCGLAASSAGCAYVPPAAALLIGLVAGALVTFTIPLMEGRLGMDDPAGALSVHGLGGIWGILAVGIFPRLTLAAIPAGPNTHAAPGGQLLAQIVGVTTLVGFVLPLSYALNWLLDRVLPQRIPPEEDSRGADLYELGAGAYPEFMTHTDEFSQW